MSSYIDKHSFPFDLKMMDFNEMELLSYEIRDFLVEKVSATGGHLSSNLGIVEIAIAVHKIFNPPTDKIIWDVGHQSYVHKILTGRADRFDTLRQFDGLSGFPRTAESEYDVFDTGHSSTSISLGLGMAVARDIAGENYKVVSVIGDGALTGGVAFEGMNNAGNMNTDIIVILNDNGMSISANTGGLSRHLRRLRSSQAYNNLKKQVKQNISKVPIIGEGVVSGMKHARDSLKYAVLNGVMFEELGFKYFGPIDGHNIRELCEALERASEIRGPVLIHAITRKGKGYKIAEAKPNVFHGIGPFDPETGELRNKSRTLSYSETAGMELIKLAYENPKIVSVSAAMVEGTGLAEFKNRFPKRTFDVGIAEGHAVSFASGLAKAGLKPFVAIYSTFLQRGYDEMLEDVCLQNLPVVFCIDRAGIVGADGETHHGLFDISYLRHMPNMTVMAPKDGAELAAMMRFAADLDEPCAIRYPRGSAGVQTEAAEVKKGSALRLREGKHVDIWALGSMCGTALEAAEILKERGIETGVIDIRFVNPLDEGMLIEAAAKYDIIVTLEDNVISGGIGEKIDRILKNSNVSVINMGWPDTFVEHGSCTELYEKYGLDSRSVAERILTDFERQA